MFLLLDFNCWVLGLMSLSRLHFLSDHGEVWSSDWGMNINLVILIGGVEALQVFVYYAIVVICL